MTDILETAGRYRVRLEVQQDAQNYNPRHNDDNLANVITLKGQRYIDVDENGGPLEEGWKRIEDTYVDAVPIFTRWARIFHGATVVEHRPYEGAWSLWYVMPDKAAETTWTPEKIIEAEIREYQAWAEGDVWGYVIEKSLTWIPKDGEVEDGDDLPDELTTWEHVDSCWGFVGREYAEDAARREFEAHKKG